jgi:hypothetical protein
MEIAKGSILKINIKSEYDGYIRLYQLYKDQLPSDKVLMDFEEYCFYKVCLMCEVPYPNEYTYLINLENDLIEVIIDDKIN